jgi:hypothetical protein
MPYWYYAGKTTSCVEIPGRGPVILVPRERFHAPRASVHHLLKTRPPQVKLLPDPPQPKNELATAPKPLQPPPVPPEYDFGAHQVVSPPLPPPVPEPVIEASKSSSSPEHDFGAHQAEDVVASPSSKSSDITEEEVDPQSEGESEPEMEPFSSKSRKRSRRSRSSGSQ